MTLDIRPHPEGATLAVRVRAKGGRDAVCGTRREALLLRVAAAPEKGRANHAVLALLASSLGVAAGMLELLSGSTCPDKVILVRGLSASELVARLAKFDPEIVATVPAGRAE